MKFQIFDQEKGIEDLNETAVQITMNIRDGNDWIRQVKALPKFCKINSALID